MLNATKTGRLMRKGGNDYMISPSMINVLKKVGGLVVSVGLPLATNYFEKKALRAETK